MAVKNQKFTDISKEDDSKERYVIGEDKKIVQAKDRGEAKPRATKYRVGAILLWIAAIFFEVIGILKLLGKLNWLPNLSTVAFVIIALVLDLICVVIASLLWKKSNRIDPASEKNKTKFWIHNNLGLLLSIVAFLPIIIFIFTNKDLDKKDKTILATIAIIFLAIAGLTGYEWNPISAEQLAKAQRETDAVAVEHDKNGNSIVYWAPVAGKKFHLTKDCHHLKNAKEVTRGTVRQAFEAGITEPCRTEIPELPKEPEEKQE